MRYTCNLLIIFECQKFDVTFNERSDNASIDKLSREKRHIQRLFFITVNKSHAMQYKRCHGIFEWDNLKESSALYMFSFIIIECISFKVHITDQKKSFLTKGLNSKSCSSHSCNFTNLYTMDQKLSKLASSND